MPRRLCILAAFVATGPASAVPLAPHRAVYDLSLAEQSRDLVAVEGRIALDLGAEECSSYAVDYRFVARFGEESEITLTDQRIIAREGQDGSSYDFETIALVDGVEQSRVEGAAVTRGDETSVTMREPVERSFDIPAARFPLAHTSHLIESARAGQRIVESRLYDGDADGENLLTTTAIITPVAGGDAQTRLDGIAGLTGWRVDESYFNADSRADGLPIFHTRYTLFENGVTDDLYMDFGDYALEGGLSELTVGERPAECP